MKKNYLSLIVALIIATIASAQTDPRLFNHLSVGLNVGTTGIGADVAMPVTRFLDIQAGFSIMPKIKYNTNVHLNINQYTNISNTIQNLNINDIPIQGKLNMVNGKVLINFYPIPISSFHITAGAYFGKGDVVEVYNTTEHQLNVINEANAAIDEYNKIAKQNGLPTQDNIGVKLGDYLLTPDAEGNVKSTLKTNGFKPYVGIGFGRAVPKKRIGFKFDLGAMFWGAPDVIDHNGVSLTKQDWDGKDGGAFKVISKIKVYPVLNFRLCGRIF